METAAAAPRPQAINTTNQLATDHMNATWRNGIAVGDPVDAVADAVVRAATDATPKLRYTPGKTSGKLRLMRRFVPEKAFAKSFRKQMNMPA